MREAEMRRIAELIGVAVRCDPETAAGTSRLAVVGEEVTGLVRRFPFYTTQEVLA
jgi:glycine hydroxymethyltransferase